MLSAHAQACYPSQNMMMTISLAKLQHIPTAIQIAWHIYMTHPQGALDLLCIGHEAEGDALRGGTFPRCNGQIVHLVHAYFEYL